jgi:hypothetical protein
MVYNKLQLALAGVLNDSLWTPSRVLFNQPQKNTMPNCPGVKEHIAHIKNNLGKLNIALYSLELNYIVNWLV